MAKVRERFNIGSPYLHELRMSLDVHEITTQESKDKIINALKEQFEAKHGVKPKVKRNPGSWYTLFATTKD